MKKKFLEDTLQKKAVFFCGKGGVGKTTVAWAAALALKRAGKNPTVAAWKAFDDLSLGEKLSQTFSIPYLPLETFSAFREYALKTIHLESVYDAIFDNRVLRTFISTTPGLSDTAISGKIMDAASHEGPLLIDLPASGHALSFFRSPKSVHEIFSLGFVHRETEKIIQFFTSSDVRIDLVTLPETLPLTETEEFYKKLFHLLPFHFGFCHLNQCLLPWDVENFVSTEAKDLHRTYRARYDGQVQALDASSLNLPRVSIPRWATAEWVRSVEATAQHLGGTA